MPVTEERDTIVKIEDARPIHIGREAVEALRGDVHRQLHEAITDAHALWEDVDVESLEDLKPLQHRLIAAVAAVEALVYLAPVPDVWRAER